MKVRPRMSVMSQLSDIQALAKFGDVERLTLLANYCKEVLMDLCRRGGVEQNL